MLDFSFALECFAKGSVRTAFGAEHESRSTVATLGENLNRARQRTRAVKCALRSAHHFDAIEIVDGEIGEIHQTGESLINWNPVEQDLSMFAAQSAGEHGSELAGRPALHNGKAWHFAQGVGDTLDLFFFEIL